MRLDAYFTGLRRDDLRRIKKRLGIFAACFGCVFLQLDAIQSARAQSSPTQVEILIPEAFEIDPAARTPVPLQLEPQIALPNEANVMIKGLPERLSLSEGKRFPSGIWGVSASALKGLQIICPEGEEGSSLLTITVVTADGTVLDGINSKLIIRSPRFAGKVERRVEQQASAASPNVQLDFDDELENFPRPLQPKFFARAELEEIQGFMKRGAEQIQLKNITVARLFFRRAAELGWAPAALAMGATYDPAELLNLHIVGGIRPDVDLARRWYERAHELGSEQARDKLAQLNAY